MSIALLTIIYIIFISLGLPDSVIGTAWPSIANSLHTSESLQGVLSISISFCTIISSFLTPFLVKKIKNYGVVTISILLTIIGLSGMKYSSTLLFMCLSAIPLGLGAGAIDSVLNNYVALHYKALHLNWLHAFWGLGAFISPLIISNFLKNSDGWRNGILVLIFIQIGIFILSLLSIPLFIKSDYQFKMRETKEEITDENIKLSFFSTFKLNRVIFVIISFFAYIAFEQISCQWFSSMMVYGNGVDEKTATSWASLFYIGICLGRFISGILSLKLKEETMVRVGLISAMIGSIMLTFIFYIPLMPVGLFIVGLGCGPIYPGILNLTPKRFGKKYSQSVMSIQIGCAYIANVTLSPLFGIVGKALTFNLLPYIIICLILICAISNEIVTKKTKNVAKAQ